LTITDPFRRQRNGEIVDLEAAMRTELLNYIGGRWSKSVDEAVRTITEPARRDAALWDAASSSTSDVATAVDAARAAAKSWRSTAPQTRAEILNRASANLRNRSEQVITDLALEQGKTRAEAERECQSATKSLDYFAAQALQPVGDVLPPSALSRRVWSERVPIGVVGCITPWNFPLLLPAYKVAPALAYGNTVVLKPASLTPASAVHLVEAFDEAGLPPGVLNLVLGSGQHLGAALIGSGGVDGLSFTGSNDVGHWIASEAARRMLRVQLEMGGKNPIIVLEDADSEAAAALAVEGAMGMAGQRCTATSRAIVAADSYGDFIQATEARLAGLRIGHPLDPESTMGPVVSGEQQAKVLGAIEGAQRSGSRLVYGGKRPSGDGLDQGYFIEPTLFVDVDPESEISQEEIFGPVIAVSRASSFESAIEIANQTRFGLSASVCTNDLDLGLEAVDALDFGMIHVNQPTSGAERYAPFGGMKNSGYGAREQGLAAREFFTEWKTAYISR
jgi:aldehyde dehydrogenase (NAD+)